MAGSSNSGAVRPRDGSYSFFNIVPPQDGGRSLLPMESLLRGVRNVRDALSLEMFGREGVVGYCVRTNNGNGFSGLFHSHFPQSQLIRSENVQGRSINEGDWFHLDEDEFALVQTLSLEKDSYLPLRIFDARSLEQGEIDPLAGVIGVLASDSRTVGHAGGGDRLGVRLVARPAAENWGFSWQKRMQTRRDGEDRAARSANVPGGGGPSVGMVMALVGLLGLVVGNWMLWDSGNLMGMALLDAGALGLGGLLLSVGRRFFGGSKRPYMDETLVEDKLKSLAFHCELQLVRIYRRMEDENVARASLDELASRLRAFDDPAGNSWSAGRVRQYSGQRVFQGDQRHPFHGGLQELDWMDRERAVRTVLSVSEVSSLWHLPLGSMDMAVMERNSAGFLTAYLGDLRDAGESFGPLVGMDWDGNGIRLPESAVRKHVIIVGKSGFGKSTLVKHVVAHKLKQKAAGRDNDAIVVVDPHADLVRDLLDMVPLSIAHKVRLLDFGRLDRVPGLNLVDPQLFPDRDRCVDTIVTTLKGLWDAWGNRLEDLLRNALLIVYEFNQHPDTQRSEMLTMLDILYLLEDGVITGQGRDRKMEMSARQREILSRVSDPRLQQWFSFYLTWPLEHRSEAVAPVRSRIGAYANRKQGSVVLGQRESTIVLSEVLSEGLVLLVSTSQGSVGKGASALMGGTMVSLLESELREQEKLPFAERKRCLLVCDEFQTITGADWESLFAEIRKYGCSMMLATQSMARLNSPDRNLKEGVLANVGVIVAYQMSAEDAEIIAPEMDASRVEERFLVNVYPHHCYIRINSETKCYPAFSMKTLPPPENTEGSFEAKAEVIRASAAYTTDFEEARARLNAEILQQLSEGTKLGTDMDQPGATVYDRAVAKGSPARRRRGGNDGGSMVVDDERREGPEGGGGSASAAGPGRNGGSSGNGASVKSVGPAVNRGSSGNGASAESVGPAVNGSSAESGVPAVNGASAGNGVSSEGGVPAAPADGGALHSESAPAVWEGGLQSGRSGRRGGAPAPQAGSSPPGGGDFPGGWDSPGSGADGGSPGSHADGGSPGSHGAGDSPGSHGASPAGDSPSSHSPDPAGDSPDSGAPWPDVGGAPGRSASSLRSGEVSDRILRGPLKGLAVEDIKKSKLSVGALETLASLPEDDPAFRAIQDKRLGDLISKTRRDVRREESEAIREEVRLEYEARLAEKVRQVREEERMAVTAEFASGVLASSGKEKPARDPAQVKRPFLRS